MTNDRRLLRGKYALAKPVAVKVATGVKISVKEAGLASLPCADGGAIEVDGVLHSTELNVNLLAVVGIVDAGATVKFEKTKAVIERDGVVIHEVPRVGNLYTWTVEDSHEKKKKQETAMSVAAPSAPLLARVVSAPVAAVDVPAVRAIPSAPVLTAVQKAHIVHGHPSRTTMKHMLRVGALKGLDVLKTAEAAKELDAPLQCAPCVLGKSQRKAFAKAVAPEYRASAPMEKWSCDLSGPIELAGSSVAETITKAVVGVRPSSRPLLPAEAKTRLPLLFAYWAALRIAWLAAMPT